MLFVRALHMHTDTHIMQKSLTNYKEQLDI